MRHQRLGRGSASADTFRTHKRCCTTNRAREQKKGKLKPSSRVKGRGERLDIYLQPGTMFLKYNTEEGTQVFEPRLVLSRAFSFLSRAKQPGRERGGGGGGGKSKKKACKAFCLPYLVRVDLEALVPHVRHETLEVGDVGVPLLLAQRVHPVLHHVEHFLAASRRSEQEIPKGTGPVGWVNLLFFWGYGTFLCFKTIIL